MKPVRVVLTGATGFIGSGVLRELLRQRGGSGTRAGRRLCIRVVGRRPPQTADSTAAEWVRADLARPETLHGVCRGADVLLHMAAAIGSDEAECVAINQHGTAALMEEAVRAGTGRIVHLSTSAVYGPGPHRGIAVDEVTPAPASAVSRTRLAGEAHALAAGASVLRPGLVLGAGDRWVVPLLAECLRVVPYLWDGGRGRVSAVAVEDLARLVTRLALVPQQTGGPRVWHASHPEPVRVGDLLDTLARHQVLPPVSAAIPWAECLSMLRAAETFVTERQFALVATDHWYDSRDVWDAAGCPAGPGPLASPEGAVEWYRSALAKRPAA
ncbi:NAD(P)-dependent oxidoreductase [Streptomyces sp. NPDC013178]|uniref:NAD-dependent epimerase/dehydratase family protein n=1 Tax=Streptomyces sp. NPDC013178 TaxID=3155118 RepID=UPI0033C326D7